MIPATLKQANPRHGGEPVLPEIERLYGERYPEIVADIQARADVGLATYGQRGLHLDDGRDHLVDAYQESLDLVHYLSAVALKAARVHGEGSDQHRRALAVVQYHVIGAEMVRLLGVV